MEQQMTTQKLIFSMFNAVSANLTEVEYKLLQIPKFRIFKRKKFSSIYKTLLLHLTKLSIPRSFPDNKDEILGMFDEWYKLAYKNNQSAKKEIDKDIKKFEELTNLNHEKPFENLSRYIVELFEQKHKKLLFITLLEKKIESLFNSFINTGKQIEIIKNPDEINIIDKLEENKN